MKFWKDVVNVVACYFYFGLVEVVLVIDGCFGYLYLYECECS